MSTRVGWKTYQDFVLKIVPAGEGRYRVEAQAPTGEARADFEVPFDQRDLQLLLFQIGHPRKAPTLGQVSIQMQPAVEFGGRLYGAVVRGGVRDLLMRARYAAEQSNQGLRVQLRLADVPELADWPWELLYDGRDFLALSDATPLVRYLDLPEPPRPIQVQPPLRILVTISSPYGLPELDVAEEKANLERALAALSTRGLVQVDFAPDATFSTLQRTLYRARNGGRPYHVWHYVGHGAFVESRGASMLAFCTAQNQLQRVGDLELGTLFNNCPEMRLVLLNACEGARPDPGDPFAGVAAGLVGRGVPAVVGMQFEITVEAARAFSQGFYEALLDGLPVDAALTAARLAVFGMPNWTEWATPVLYMRAPDGRIFDVAALAPDRASRPSKAEASEMEARRERLSSLYTEALEVYYAARWARAVDVLDEIVSLQADYRRAAPMLEEARLQHELAEGYARGSVAYDGQNWAEAIECLEAVVALDAGYLDAADRLQEARRRKELADLYADARQLHQAQRWQAAIQALERIQNLEPDYSDLDGLLDSARVALEAEERAHKLATLYGQALQHIEVQEWSEALECLEQIARWEPGYRETDALLARVQRELEAQERARSLAEYYGRGIAAHGVQDWDKAIQSLQAVIALDAGYRDAADRLQEARRQKELADLYADARQLHQAQRWQAAIQTLERIQAVEPAYPDPDGLLDAARAALHKRTRKLAALYTQGVQHIEAQEWSEALQSLEQVAGIESGYRQTETLLARVRRKLEPARPGVQPSIKCGVPSWPVWAWVVLGAVALLLVGGVIWGVRSARERPVAQDTMTSAAQPTATSAAQPTATSAAQPTATSAAQPTATSTAQSTATSTAVVTPVSQVGATRVREKDGAAMVYVPAGEFWMGSTERDIDAVLGECDVCRIEMPRHKVYVDAFWLDRTEVTNGQYRQCVGAGACTVPGSSSSFARSGYYGNVAYDDYPVINVTWHQAREYAEWVGGRLPTEAEWEYACRGPSGSVYPWGNRSPDNTLLNYDYNVGDTTKVGSYPEEKSWCGALDMAGNVSEWMQSVWKGYPYDPGDGREDLDTGEDRVTRGGTFHTDAPVVRCAFRGGGSMTDWDWSLGFRVCVVAQ